MAKAKKKSQRPAQPEDGTIVTTIRINARLWSQFKSKSALRDMTVSEHLTELIAKAVA